MPFTQFREMRNALQDARSRQVHYVEIEEAGHGFTKPEDEQAWYDALVGFLSRYNPPGTAASDQSPPPSDTTSS